jgi:hypothetical protein
LGSPRWTDASCGGASLDEAVVAAFDAGVVFVAGRQKEAAPLAIRKLTVPRDLPAIIDPENLLH